MRKIAIITGSRGEYGYLRPIIKAIQNDPDMDYLVVATNMHLLSEFGHSIDEFKKDGFKIEEKIYNTFDGYTPLTMAKSLGVFLMQLPGTLERTKPDIILCAGDRGENMVTAMAGAYMNIPVAHIQAGELSGNIDGITRHAITKFAHIHFCANASFADRVEKMGEQKFRIFNTGAPQLDELIKEETTPRDILFKKYGLLEGKPVIILVQHPVTEEFGKELAHMNETLKAVTKFDAQVFCIFPNSDAGNKEIKNSIDQHRGANFKIFRNIPREDYAGIMKNAEVIIGNSSSGIIESPVFKLPSVNIGRRQQDRLQAENVINVNYNEEEIVKAVEKALTPEFKKIAASCVSPYGDGQSSERIVRILKDVEIDEQLLNKKLTY